MTTTFLTTNQRAFLIEEYAEQLLEWDQEHLIKEYTDWLRVLGNADFLQECVEQMPFYGELAGRKILAAHR